MKVRALTKRAEAEGVGEEGLEDALECDSPKLALVELRATPLHLDYA